jgi:rhodanese-related sulfurtransferase
MTDFSFSPHDLALQIGTAQAPVLLDVRRDAAFDASPKMLKSATRCAPQNISAWANTHLAWRDRKIVVYCVYGHQVSQGAAEQLREHGFNAFFLAGGFMGGEDGIDAASDIAHWRAAKLSLVGK